MIRRFIEWLLPLLILAAALCLLWGALSRGPSAPRSEAAVGLLLAYVVRGTS